jgi:hypothetical protein
MLKENFLISGMNKLRFWPISNLNTDKLSRYLPWIYSFTSTKSVFTQQLLNTNLFWIVLYFKFGFSIQTVSFWFSFGLQEQNKVYRAIIPLKETILL